MHNDGQEEVYLSSADWMPRNLDKRVEILFPVEDEELKAEVIHILQIQLEDTLKAHILKPDDMYEKVDKRGKKLLCAQEYFCAEATDRAEQTVRQETMRSFIPMEGEHREQKE